MDTTNQRQEPVILIIDDEQTNLNVILDTLACAGLTTITARNGDMGIKRAQFAQPDLIVLDVMMPGIDGFETCRRLKADPATRDIPVLFMTALADVQNKVTGFEAGGVDYITKPIEERETLARIQTHLALRKAQQDLQDKNRRLEESEESLRQANATKDTFFSILAHDLRSPFTGLLGLVDMAMRELETPNPRDLHQHLARIKRSAEAVYGLLGNLLTWARIQREAIDFQPAALPLGAFVTNLLPLFSLTAERKQIDIHLQIPAAISVYADANMVSTAIRNLISNALKFTQNGGRITISAWQQGTEVTLAIADTGVGIPEDTLANLFRIDRKTSTTGTAGEPGSGLGLPLCKDLLEQTGGCLRIESLPGQGTTCVMTLPSTHDAVHARDDTEPECVTSVAQPPAASPAPMTAPPEKELHRLYEAARSGDIAEIRLCLQELGAGEAGHHPFCQTIAAMADEFRLGKIEEFLFSYLTASEPASDSASLSEALGRLPDDMQKRLHHAAESLQTDAIQAIIEQIRRHDASLAGELTALVRQFQFPSIVEALEHRT